MSENPNLQFKILSVLEDPSLKAIARVYAAALLGAQADVSGEDRIAEFQSFIDDVLVANPAFEAILVSRLVSSDDKVAALDRVVSSRASTVFGNFLKVVASHDRLDLLRIICDVASEMQIMQSGKSQVILRTAVEVSKDKLEQIQQNLKDILSVDPVLHVKTDPSIIGGMIIQIGDTVYDSSLRNRLGQLQSRLRKRYLHEIQSGRNRFSHTEGS